MADYRVIACEVFKEELLLGLSVPAEKCLFLPQGLHRTPDQLGVELQKAIDQLDEEGGIDRIYLGYGLCGNGVAGVKSCRSRLVIPDSEDCIPVLHGLPGVGQGRAIDRITSYYLSHGWIAYGKDGWKEYERCLTIFDQETAYWCVKEMLKHYKRFTLIDTGMLSHAEDQAYTHKVSTFFGLEDGETQGSLDWLESLLREDPAFNLTVLPGVALETRLFAVNRESGGDTAGKGLDKSLSQAGGKG